MYCFQCGEELVEGAKFCHVCGANQEEARKLFEKKFKHAAPTTGSDHPASGGDTKVAYSSDPDDGEALKNYLNKVDTHVGMSIEKHETLSGARPKPKKQKAKDKPAKKVQENIENAAPPSSAMETAPVEKAAPKAQAPAKADEPKKKKKSFSAIWNSFIDEEDNPYSVFGEMADRLERNQRVVDDTDADRLRVSQDMGDMDQEPFAQTGDLSTLNKKVNEILDAQEKEEEKKMTSKGILSSFFSKDKGDGPEEKESPKAKDDTATVPPVVSATKEKSEEKIIPADADEKISSDDAVQRIDLTDVEEKIIPADSFDFPQGDAPSVEKEISTVAGVPSSEKKSSEDKSKDAPVVDRAEEKRKKKEAKAAAKAQKRAAKKETGQKKAPFASLFAGKKNGEQRLKEHAEGGEKHHLHVSELSNNPNVLKAYTKLSHARSRVMAKGKQGVYGLLGIGFVISTLPVLFAFRGIGILAVLFSILKVAIDLFAFFFANNVARSNSCEEDDLRSRTVDNLIHWILYLIPYTLIFFILPSSSAMGRTTLGSVTPHFLLSILLYLWVLFLAYSSAHKILPKENSRDFIAWYGIIYVSIDLISKLFWIIAIFLTSTFS
ncbi:zinc ribbon domain-containing protein [Aedoeadaptatus pacaensis]|uniref:zinc ribbon domain-containing protein n=1 Tax=Aedoeadaptatus pacaensis TaxID=1776390 RepID=UPI0008383B8A|nr:zinc ribbon domain-containing protein [Peptoniphilus pacaensis]